MAEYVVQKNLLHGAGCSRASFVDSKHNSLHVTHVLVITCGTGYTCQLYVSTRCVMYTTFVSTHCADAMVCGGLLCILSVVIRFQVFLGAVTSFYDP